MNSPTISPHSITFFANPRQSGTNLWPIHHKFKSFPRAYRLPIQCQCTANQCKVLHFFRRQSPQSMSIGIVYNFGGLADFHRIGRLEKIDGDWPSLPSPCQAANAMPMRQSGTNPMPIESPFWIGEISPIHGHRGQSCSIPIPIRYQSRLRPNTVCCQSNTNRPPISCQSVINARPPRIGRYDFGFF